MFFILVNINYVDVNKLIIIITPEGTDHNIDVLNLTKLEGNGCIVSYLTSGREMQVNERV